MKGAIRHRLTAGMLAVLVSFAASCSDDDPAAPPPPPPPPPTLTGVSPSMGSALGGTVLTLSGTDFVAGAIVTVGGVSATSVNVLNDSTITGVSPAGTPGPAPISVTTAGGTATFAGGFAYNPTPTVASVTPPSGSSFGGTTLTIAGTGFTANGAGANMVDIGGATATNVVTLNDLQLTCNSPAGTPGAVAVTVTNANGAGSLASAYTYFSTILAAEGGGGLTGNLFAVDAATGAAYLVGPIGFSVTAMDFHPTTGVLFGVTAGGAAARKLITINPVTGAGWLIGPTNDGTGSNHKVPGCSFVGSTLFGTDGPGRNFISIDHNTALVTILGPNLTAAPGGGFAADATNSNVFYMNSASAPLWSVNVTTGAFTPGPTLSGGNILNCATFHNGTLFAIDSDAIPGGGGSSGNRQLVTIDTTTGVITPVGPPFTFPSLMDAIASPTR